MDKMSLKRKDACNGRSDDRRAKKPHVSTVKPSWSVKVYLKLCLLMCFIINKFHNASLYKFILKTYYSWWVLLMHQDLIYIVRKTSYLGL